MQTEWREDYSHQGAKYFLEGMEWIDLPLGREFLDATTRAHQEWTRRRCTLSSDCLLHSLPAALPKNELILME
jgi:hypothetical protein